MSKKEKCAKTQKNRIVIHHGDEEKRIYKGLLDTYLKEGWSLGQSDKHRKSSAEVHKGKEPWNKGKGRVLTKAEIHSLITMYMKVTSLSHCCKNLNIPFATAYRYFKENNLLREKSEALKGRTRPVSVKEAIAEKNKGHEVSEKTRKAVSQSNKRRTVEQRKIQVTKAFLTKMKNKSFNTSMPEENFYEMLLKKNINKTIYRQYKDKKRYPYYCDFYIKEEDLFIELNAHWTHGGHPFDPTSKKDLETLALWQEKAKQSKFYAQAIYIWTELDPKKQKCAKDNNLNYKAIY